MADPAVNAGFVRWFRTSPHVDEYALGRRLVARYLRARPGEFRTKRAVDLLVTLLASPFALLVISVAAACIWLEDRSRVFFIQPRVGRDGEIFPMFKLRTMRNQQDGQAFTELDDDRVTRVGRFLRKYRIDELPQLLNVLRGEMSICGPRPEAVPLSRVYEDRIPGYHRRHATLPGLTGWAQVQQGYAVGVEACTTKLSYDLYYMANASIWLDLAILVRTVDVVLLGRGAR